MQKCARAGDTAAITLGLLRGHPESKLPWTPLANGEIIAVTSHPGWPRLFGADGS
jgi:hypothetical protein